MSLSKRLKWFFDQPFLLLAFLGDGLCLFLAAVSWQERDFSYAVFPLLVIPFLTAYLFKRHRQLKER